jgi:hypothetical protein
LILIDEVRGFRMKPFESEEKTILELEVQIRLVAVPGLQ